MQHLPFEIDRKLFNNRKHLSLSLKINYFSWHIIMTPPKLEENLKKKN